MDMKGLMLIFIYFCIFMLVVDKGKEWDNYKMEVVIRKRWEIVIRKINRKKRNYLFRKMK
jgi:hypothetical protein